MADQNTAKPDFYPDYVNELLTLLGKIRDFHGVIEEAPTSTDVLSPGQNVMYGWQLDELFGTSSGVLYAMYQEARVTIRIIRDVKNANPILQVDQPEFPDPDPIDDYYFPYGSLSYSNEANPTSGSVMSPYPSMRLILTPRPGPGLPRLGPLPLPLPWPRPRPKPWPPKPPWPPWPPPPPPPTYWRPVAEEDYSYIYAYYTTIGLLSADRQPSKLYLEYLGYFAMEMAKRCYELHRFYYDDLSVRRMFATHTDHLRNVIYP